MFRTFPIVSDPAHEVLRTRADGTLCDARVWFEDWHFADRHGALHHAQDVFAPEGALVVAMQDGEITTGSSAKGGLWVKLEGSAGVLYMSHLSRVYARSGDEVRAGAVLGRVGKTGNAANTCPHLHISWKNARGQAMNLFSTLRQLEAQPRIVHTFPASRTRARVRFAVISGALLAIGGAVWVRSSS